MCITVNLLVSTSCAHLVYYILSVQHGLLKFIKRPSDSIGKYDYIHNN